MAVASVHTLTASSLVLEGTLSSPVGIGLWFLDDPGWLWLQFVGTEIRDVQPQRRWQGLRLPGFAAWSHSRLGCVSHWHPKPKFGGAQPCKIVVAVAVGQSVIDPGS